MISVILYGRNDSYGYNLHKRAALSLNCIAEVLESSDEIIFVDYNTPDDFPTFPEAIFDTLTEKALTSLRILRVRPTIHDRFKSKTHLPALEPIARNIAVRRSLPSNRWILSTNTDLIFVPLQNRTLTDICRDLGEGFYHAPRIELPETLWEGLDRQKPRDAIDRVQEWGNTLHINEIVLNAFKFIRYDGPGDFQLIQRSDLFSIHGFHEKMLLGWHVDSNIAQRLGLLHGKLGDLGDKVFGYHCDHTRQATGMHSHTRTMNDWRVFFDEVQRPEVPEQAHTWGCPDDDIEEIRLVPRRTQIYIRALQNAIGKPLERPIYTQYASQTYNQTDYDPRHIMPFLADLFSSSSNTANVVWYGLKYETLRLFSSVWRDLVFKENITIDSDHPFLELTDLERMNTRFLPSEEALSCASVFVFDFGAPLAKGAGKDETSSYSRRIEELLRVFLAVVGNERERMRSGRTLRRVVAINAINNEFETLVCQFLAITYSPFSGRMRHGFVLPPTIGKQDWLQALSPGPAGVRAGPEIVTRKTKLGILTLGPCRHLDAGRYRLTIRLSAPVQQRQLWKDEPCAVLEVLSAQYVFGVFVFRGKDHDNEDRNFSFNVPPHIGDAINKVETRLRVLAEMEVAVRALTIELVDSGDPAIVRSAGVLQVDNCLPFLHLGPAGEKDGACVQLNEGREGVVVYGPYWPLPRGRYFLVLTFEGDLPLQIGSVDVVSGFSGDRDIARAHLSSQSGTFGLPFEITEDLEREAAPIETRLFSSGASTCRLLSVSVQPIPYPSNWLPFLIIGPAGQLKLDPAGRTDHASIRVHDGLEQVAAYGPYWKLPVGRYELVVVVSPNSFVWPSTVLGKVDVSAESCVLAAGELRVTWHAVTRSHVTVRLPFEVSSAARDALVETRVWAAGGPGFSIRRVSVVAQAPE